MSGKRLFRYKVVFAYAALILPGLLFFFQRPSRLLSRQSVRLEHPEPGGRQRIPKLGVSVPFPEIRQQDELVDRDGIFEQLEGKGEDERAERGTEPSVDRETDDRTEGGSLAIANRETEQNLEDQTKEQQEESAEVPMYRVLSNIEKEQSLEEEEGAKPEDKAEGESDEEEKVKPKNNPEEKTEDGPEEKPEDKPESPFQEMATGQSEEQTAKQLEEKNPMPNQKPMTQTGGEAEEMVANPPKEEPKMSSSEQQINQTSKQPGEKTVEKSTPVDEQSPEEKFDEEPEKPEANQSQPKQSDADPKDNPQHGVEAAPEDQTELQAEEPATQLPPRLKPSLAHIKRPPNNSLTEPYDWRRPAMLTALGLPDGDKLKLVTFSTGVDLIGFNRCFHFLGCLVGNKTYPRMFEDQRTPQYCLVDRDIPSGAQISLLLRRDETMEGAIEKPLVYREFTFENSEDDFLKLSEDVVVHDKVRELAEGHGIVTIKSNVTWHEGLHERPFNPGKKRFELCLMTAMRQYPFLMQEWFDYYRRVGVDQIYVYDNVASEDLSQFDSDFVQTAFWPFGRSQQQSFNHFLVLSRNRCKYVGFFDADEYAFVGVTGPNAMKRYVKKRMTDGYDQIVFPFIVMAGSGYIERPEGFLPDLYTRRSLRQKKFHVGKTVLVSEAKWKRHGVHMANGGGKVYKNSSFELNPTSLGHNGMLVHYTRRSWEEFILKQNAGGASVVTNARAPQNMTMEGIPNYHLSNDSTAEYLTFRDRWRAIMNMPEPRDLTLSWRNSGKECTQQYCIACNGKEIGQMTCN